MDILRKSSQLKIKLLLHGVKIESSAYEGLGTEYKEYQYGYNDSNWLSHQKRKVIPSELVLPGGIVVACHLRPNSPYTIFRKDDNMYIYDENTQNILSEVSYLPRPQIWDLTLSNGHGLKEYLNIYGADCLNLFIVADCDFWNEGMPCVFCSLRPTQNLHRAVIKYKELDEIEEALKLAFSVEGSLKWMIITGGSLKNRKDEVERYYNVLSRIKKHVPSSWDGKIRGNAALLPTNDEKDLEQLYATGIEHPSFNLEVWGKTRFKQYCAGKEKYVSFDKIIDTYKKAVKIWGAGQVWCNFVGGITPIEDLKEGFRFMADIGVVPGANIFHLDPGATAAQKGLCEPNEDYVLEMYHCLSSIYREYGYRPFFSERVLRNSISNEMYNGWI